MTTFLLNVLLALLWLILSAELSPGNFILGFVGGYAVLRTVRSVLPSTSYYGKGVEIVCFFGYFSWELVRANARVAYDVLTHRHYMKPAVVAVPLDVTSDEEITLLANLITLTPGTLSLEVSKDRKTLYVHAMYVEDLDEFRAEIKNGLEQRVKELLR